jgi:hypothetical protein
MLNRPVPRFLRAVKEEWKIGRVENQSDQECLETFSRQADRLFSAENWRLDLIQNLE